ncbi:hypothetical protein ACYPKM_01990 [Pseudomonas aeruginosa]
MSPKIENRQITKPRRRWFINMYTQSRVKCLSKRYGSDPLVVITRNGTRMKKVRRITSRLTLMTSMQYARLQGGGVRDLKLARGFPALTLSFGDKLKIGKYL